MATKFRKTSNGGIPAIATVQSSRSTGVTSLSVDTQQFWPAGSTIDFSTYKIDPSDNTRRLAGSQTDWEGVSNGTNTLSSLVVVGGAADSGNAIGDKVQMGPTADWAEGIVDGLLNEHNDDGTHKNITADSLTVANDASIGGDAAIAGSLTVAGQDVNQSAPPGVISMYAAAAAPTGWLLCDGSAVSRAANAALFSAISTTYGVGDGSTTFNLPNLQGRVPVGKNGGTFNPLGSTGGEETHALTVPEMPSHNHTLGAGHSIKVQGSGSSMQPLVTDSPSDNSGSTGGGGAHNNLQPYQVVNFIIKK